MSILPPKTKKTTSKRTKYVLWILGVVLVWYLYGEINTFSRLVGTLEYPAPFPKITDTYKEVFANYDSTRIKPSYTFLNKVKNPISTFFVNNGNGDLMIYKIDNIETSQPLEKILNIVWNDSRGSQKGLYNSSYRNASMTFSDLDKKPIPVETIFLDINGIQEGKSFVSDSLICYNIDVSSFGAYYINPDSYDFYFEKTTRLLGQKYEIQLAFLRKNSFVYMLILSPTPYKDLRHHTSQLYSLLYRGQNQ